MEILILEILFGILANRIDKAITSFRQSLKKANSSVQNQLKKAVNQSVLSALQNVVLDCHKKLYPHKFMGILPVYPPEHRDDLKWLDQKCNQLAKQLKQLERESTVDTPFASPEEIESLFNSTTPLTTENIQVVKEKLIAYALKGNAVPDCYKRKVKADLFDQVRENFEWKIRYDQVLHNFVTDAKLTQLISQRNDATAAIMLDVDINDINTPQFLAIVEELKQQGKDVTLKIRSIMTSSVKLVLDGSQEGIRRIEELFKSGQLTEVLGIPIKDVRVELPLLPSSHIQVNLSQWLQNVFEEGWQTVETLLGTEKAELAFGYRSSSTASITQAKLIDLGIPYPVVLTVAISPKADSEREILLQIHTTAEQKYLPSNLQLIVLDDSGMPVLDDNGVALEAQARSTDNFIQVSLYGQPGEQFDVKIALEDASVIENFVI